MKRFLFLLITLFIVYLLRISFRKLVVSIHSEHMIGNVCVKFKREEDAEKAMKGCNNRWFDGRPVYAELSPVTDFRYVCFRSFFIE